MDEHSPTSEDLIDAARIEPTVLNEEFIRLPADLARWNEALSRTTRDYLRAKLALKIGEAKLRMEHRAAGVASKEKFTQGDLDALVLADPRYEEMCMNEIAAEAEKVRLAGAVDAIRSKRDMLISLGANMRAEMQPMSINRISEMERKAFPPR